MQHLKVLRPPAYEHVLIKILTGTFRKGNWDLLPNSSLLESWSHLSLLVRFRFFFFPKTRPGFPCLYGCIVWGFERCAMGVLWTGKYSCNMFLWGFGTTAGLQSLMLGIWGYLAACRYPQLWFPLHKCVIPNEGMSSCIS